VTNEGRVGRVPRHFALVFEGELGDLPEALKVDDGHVVAGVVGVVAVGDEQRVVGVDERASRSVVPVVAAACIGEAGDDGSVGRVVALLADCRAGALCCGLGGVLVKGEGDVLG